MHSPKQKPKIGNSELTVMMAAIIALNALAIDAMLPAFPRMVNGLGLSDPNDVQYVIGIYLLANGIGSLFHGPLSDRFGRRPILIGAIVGYILSAFACRFATSFDMLMVTRIAQGLCGAALSVLVTSIIRDQFEGDAMAKRMSTIFLIFMAVPIIAPLIGSAILVFAGWRSIFDMMAFLAIAMLIWVGLRLPETLHPDAATPIQFGALTRAWRMVVTHRTANSYLIAGGLAHGALFGYLNSSQQIFDKGFGVPEFFPFGFAIVAIGIACANFTNARIVERFGARRLSQSALVGFILLGLLQLLAAWFVPQSLPLFLILITLNMAMIGFVGSNFSSIAMQPFGAVAGSASSFQSFVRTIMSALIGAWIGQQFTGSVVPMASGFLLCGLAALALVAFGERGQLFTRPGTTKHLPLP
ncbi:multidrug effflux MFS transporter [Sphingorhabdus sp.]|jgi:DHA1 family bicyclomycin/chloramphenicol resistance-like MFS transporter|uniref:multidrug effflux MFS transporter n=1 Tax=Sphingorhabdus sp. TaxID=1902408 RepID=UPI0037C7FB31